MNLCDELCSSQALPVHPTIISPFHFSPRFCPSNARCSPPSMCSIVLCMLFSCSRWFPPSLLCGLPFSAWSTRTTHLEISKISVLLPFALVSKDLNIVEVIFSLSLYFKKKSLECSLDL